MDVNSTNWYTDTHWISSGALESGVIPGEPVLQVYLVWSARTGFSASKHALAYWRRGRGFPEMDKNRYVPNKDDGLVEMILATKKLKWTFGMFHDFFWGVDEHILFILLLYSQIPTTVDFSPTSSLSL